MALCLHSSSVESSLLPDYQAVLTFSRCRLYISVLAPCAFRPDPLNCFPAAAANMFCEAAARRSCIWRETTSRRCTTSASCLSCQSYTFRSSRRQSSSLRRIRRICARRGA
jgi:hypothetical protein